MSGAKKFAREDQARNHRVVSYYQPISKEKLSPSDKVTPSEEVEKGIDFLDYMDNTKFTGKIDLPMSNDSVIPKKVRYGSDDE